MGRPAGLIRAGFPYVRTIGDFHRTQFPLDVAVGKEGRLYVLCGNHGPITVMDIDGNDLGSFGDPAQGYRLPTIKGTTPTSCAVPEGFVGPVSMTADENENLFISDEHCHRVAVYSRDGRFLNRWGVHGTGDGEFDRPSGLAFDLDQNLYVVDALNHRVQKFTIDGRFLGAWGTHGNGPGQFDMPWGIALDELGDIYVADWRNDRVQKFDSDMKFLFAIGTPGDGDGEFHRPSGVAVDKDGDIYVCDWGNSRVQLFAPDGRFVQKFNGDATLSSTTLARMKTQNKRFKRLRESGSIDLEKLFGRPRSVRVDEEGHMFVADFECARVQIYKKEVYPLDDDDIASPLRSPTLVN